MKINIILFLIIITINQVLASPKAVGYVDFKKFSGLWYEIARTYNSFEKDCVAATVEYKIINKSKYEVINRCFNTEFNGELIKYNGTAKAFGQDNMNIMNLTYFWIFTKKYKLIYLEKDYTSAVMVSEDLENVWIMNREPFMDKKRLKKIVSILSNSIDISKLIYTPQHPQGKYK